MHILYYNCGFLIKKTNHFFALHTNNIKKQKKTKINSLMGHCWVKVEPNSLLIIFNLEQNTVAAASQQ
jgi:hypothetical protein